MRPELRIARLLGALGRTIRPAHAASSRLVIL